MPASDDFVREPKRMHRVFALSSVILAVSVVVMTVADYDDEWRDYQKTFYKIEAEKLRQDIAGISSGEYKAQIAALRDDVDKANQELKETLKGKSESEADIEEATLLVDLKDRAVKAQRALRDVAKSKIGLAVDSGASDEELEKLHRIYEEEQDKVVAMELALEEANTRLSELQELQQQLTSRRDKAAERFAQLQKALEQKEAALNQIEPDFWLWRFKRWTMEWPILDGFNSPLKIDKDGWMPQLKIKLGMATTDRFDRCRTCHMGIDKIGAGNVPSYPHGEPESDDFHDWVAENKFPHPYSTHPRTDLYLTSASPHPFKDFGCTICHEGQGSGTSFQNASHTPNDPAQEHEWEEKYDWFNNHFWEYPMLPQRFQESHCLKCHHNVVELGTNPKFGPTAPKLVKGYELIRTYGCFGCHEINGFKGADPIGPDLRLEPQTAAEAKKYADDPGQVAGTMRKVGPSLRYLASKTTPGWIEHWVTNPQNFRPTTRMPRFFDLTNQQDHLAQKLQPVEISAIARFLIDNSQEFNLVSPAEGYQPNAERGKDLFAKRGCLACHSHSEFPEATATFGPKLDRVHEKLPDGQKGFGWLYSWLKEPNRYHARTKMPDLFLDPYVEPAAGDKPEQNVDPAADIAAWLLGGGPKDWPQNEVDDDNLNVLVELYMRKVLTKADFEDFMKTRDISQGGSRGKEKLLGDEIEFWRDDLTDKMPTDEQWQQMRLNYVGRRTITRYGCYGCHDIPKFEAARPIGTGLNDWGRKDQTKLAPEHIERYFEEPRWHLKVIPVPDEDEAEKLVKGFDKVRAFNDLYQSRTENPDVADKPFETTVMKGDHHPVLGDVTPVLGLDFDEWLKEPLVVERDGQTYAYLVLATKVESETEEILQSVKDGLVGNASDEEMTKAFLYQSLTHHGRAGFLWQKLRQPRSYDYATLDHKGTIEEDGKVEAAGYEDRLRMPKFPFQQDDIEAIATFVLGLVAEPPIEKYLYRPDGPAGDRIAGEKLLEKYNCTGCHQLDMARFKYHAPLSDLPGPADTEPLPSTMPAEKPPAVSEENFARQPEQRETILHLLEKIRPPKTISVPGGAANVTLDVTGQVAQFDPDFNEYSFDLWDHVLIERTDMAGMIVIADKSSEEPRTEISLTADDSVYGELTQDPGSGLLTLRLLRRVEDGEPEPVDAKSATLRLDLTAGPADVEMTHRTRNGTAVSGEFVLPGDALPEEMRNFNDLFGTLIVKMDDMRITPASRLLITGDSLISHDDGRGGEFARFLVNRLSKTTGMEARTAWSLVPPPLYGEGEKVQTPWLYRFLLQPEKLRPMTVLRMPKFNLDPAEAQTLADYFAARDGAKYPYQAIPEKEPPYLSKMNQALKQDYGIQEDYLTHSWKLLNSPLCIKCHSLGGRENVATPSNDPAKPTVQGPNLDRVERRLRPDWVMLWVANPAWITPYTAMPQNFAIDKHLFAGGMADEHEIKYGMKPMVETINLDLFHGDPAAQIQAARDALMNHAALLQSQGIVEIIKTEQPAAETAAGGTN